MTSLSPSSMSNNSLTRLSGVYSRNSNGETNLNSPPTPIFCYIRKSKDKKNVTIAHKTYGRIWLIKLIWIMKNFISSCRFTNNQYFYLPMNYTQNMLPWIWNKKWRLKPTIKIGIKICMYIKYRVSTNSIFSCLNSRSLSVLLNKI